VGAEGHSERNWLTAGMCRDFSLARLSMESHVHGYPHRNAADRPGRREQCSCSIWSRTSSPYAGSSTRMTFRLRRSKALFTAAGEDVAKHYMVAEFPWGPPGGPGKKYLL
jgi:hypothetical protein